MITNETNEIAEKNVREFKAHVMSTIEQFIDGIIIGARASVMKDLVERLSSGIKLPDGTKFAFPGTTHEVPERFRLQGRYVGLIVHVKNRKVKSEAKRIYAAQGPEAAIKFLVESKEQKRKEALKAA